MTRNHELSSSYEGSALFTLETPSPKGPLRVAFPAKIHEFYFPQLFLDLPVEPPAGRAA